MGPGPVAARRQVAPDEVETGAGVPRARPSALEDLPPPNRTYSGINMVAPEDAFAEAKHFVRELRTSDKLAFIGAALTAFTAFLPWKETASEGEVLGLMSLGVASFIANGVAMAAIAVRVRNAMPRLHPVIPWLVQLGTVCFGLIWCLVFMKVSYNGTQVPALIGNQVVALSKPVFGVFFALLTQLVALGGTLMGLKEKA